MALTVDSHHHYWTATSEKQFLDGGAHDILNRNFGPEQLNPTIKKAGVDTTVIVQSADDSLENDRLNGYALDESIGGVVAWLPLSSPSAAQAELSRMEMAKLRGVRCTVADDPLLWLDTAACIALCRELASRRLCWDIVPITNDQMQAVLRLARTVPELNIIIDHLGRPPADMVGWEPWASNIVELAACPNVAMKISVGIDLLSSWTRWDPFSLERYVEWSLENFGPRRLMLASNWPVVLLQASYSQAWADLVSLVDMHVSSSAEREAVLGGTATDWYGLQQV
ncbi:amidohydrolase family protein [Arthrobacter pigmenti]